MSLKNIFFLSFLLLSISACVSNTPSNKTITLPYWYLNSTNVDAYNFYGTSSSYSLEVAKNQALKNVSAYLSVEISSKTDITKTSSNKNYNKSVVQNIISKTKKLQFKNAKIIKSVFLDNKYYVLVQINRAKLFDEHYNRLETLNTNITSKLQEENKSILAKIKNISSLEEQLEEAKDLAYILYAIKNDFNYKKEIKKHNLILNEKSTLISKINISIHSKTKAYKDELSSFFNKNDYKISKPSNVQVQITSAINHSKYKAWFISKANISLKISSGNKILSTHVFNLVGRSSSSFKNSDVSSSLAFKKALLARGINKILFTK